MSIRYPIDLSTRANKDFPFVQFQIAKFRERTLLKDFQGQSSVVDGNQAGKILTDQELIEGLENVPGDATDFDKIQQLRAKSAQWVINVTGGTEVIQDIFLPLPQSLQNNYSPNWEMTDMILINSILDGHNAEDTTQGLSLALQGVGAAVLNRTGQFAQKFAAMTPNPKKQALFNGIEPRTFSFDYTFSPQSLQEAETIDRIVTTFTKYSLPSLKDPTSAFFGFPCEFRILFHKTTGFPIYNWCVCTGVSTNYGPNTIQLLESGHATQIQMTLSFLETDLRTQERPGV